MESGINSDDEFSSDESEDNDADTAATVLYEIAEMGNEDTMRNYLFDTGVSVNVYSHNTTALHVAAAAQNIETVQILLYYRADVNAVIWDDYGNQRTPLHEAVTSGNNNIAQLLLKHGANVNVESTESTPLMEAASAGRKEAALLLLDHGAVVNATRRRGVTALHEAAVAGNKSIVKLLLEHGACVNITTRNSETALHQAAGGGHKQIVQLLVEHGAIVNRITHDDVTALHKACESGNSNILEFLIKHGATVNARTGSGVTPLHKAVRAGSMISVRKLLEKGASIHLSDNHGTFPIHIAVLENQDEIVKVLLNNGSNANAIDETGTSLLHQAIENGSKEILLDLLRHKACLNVVDSQGRSALQMAVMLGDLDIAAILLEKGANPNAVNADGDPILHQAIENLREETVLGLLNHGAIVNACNFKGTSALHLALDECNEYMAMILMEHGANPSTGDLRGTSALRKAINYGNIDTVITLLECGAGINYRDTEGKTILLKTVEQNNVEMVNVLLDHGANVNDRNQQDQTALHRASSWSVAQQLMEHKAWPNARELYNGDTPLLARAKNLTQSTYNFYERDDVDITPFVQWQQMLGKGMDPWIANSSGQTVLGTLLSKRKFELALSLVEAMKETDEDYLNKHHSNGDTMLHVACEYEGQELIDSLLKCGAKVNPKNQRQETPLHIACRKATQSCDVTSIDEELEPYLDTKRTVQEISDTVYFWTAGILRAYGADPSARESKGLSCFDLARDNTELLDVLTKQIELKEVPQLLKWSSKSDNHREKVGQVARGQKSQQVGTFHYHSDSIGVGAFGFVFAGVDGRDGREVAVKRLIKQEICRPEDDREIRNLVEMKDCAHVVKYLSCAYDQYFSYIILELMEGNLDDYMKTRKDTKQNLSMCRDVVMGLNFLHNNKVLHRDIKPSNILYKTNPSLSLKIADFGLSVKKDLNVSRKTTVLHTNAGTPCWMASELLNSTVKVKHAEESDIFSCGLLLHFILAERKHPFAPADNVNRSKVDADITTMHNIMNNVLTLDSKLCTEAKHIVAMMLDKEPCKRPKTTVLLQHPFYWSQEKKVSFLCAAGNQPEIEKPRHLAASAPSSVEQDLENSLGTEFATRPWDTQIPLIYSDMTAAGRRRRYVTSSAVDLLRFVRNCYAHVSDAKRPTPMKKLLLENFVFFDRFPSLLMDVYHSVVRGGWDSTREEIAYSLNQ